jgi:hypothetical protein
MLPTLAVPGMLVTLLAHDRPAANSTADVPCGSLKDTCLPSWHAGRGAAVLPPCDCSAQASPPVAVQLPALLLAPLADGCMGAACQSLAACSCCIEP